MEPEAGHKAVARTFAIRSIAYEPRGSLAALGTNNDKPRLHQMDGLRGVAMLLVFLGHFGPMWRESVRPGSASHIFLQLIDADATFGSSFFMLLSGFFAYGSLRRNTCCWAFLRGRLWRLYPLYLLMTAVYLVGSAVFPQMSKLPSQPWDTAIFVLQTLVFLPGLLHVRPLMDVSWTLSFVVLFYFIEAALAAAFAALGLTRVSRFVFLTGGGLVWAIIGNVAGWWEPRTAIFWTGMALLEAVESMSGRRLLWATRLTAPAALITLVGVVLRTAFMTSHPGTSSGPLIVTVITSITLCAFVWVARFGPHWWKQLLSSSQLRRLGAASYSFYLTHGFAVKAFRYGIIPRMGHLATAPPVFWASQIVGLALSIAVARATYVLVEEPISRFVRRSPAVCQGDMRGTATHA